MRRIKKCTVFLLVLCLLLNLAGCAAAQKPLRVTLVLKTVTEVAEFWGTLLSGVEKAAEEYMAGLYRNLVMDPFSRQQYRKFFGILLDQKEGAVLWHCSAGKDRVGVGTALLLSALGVPRETILADYMMVNTFTAEVVESRLEELNEGLQNPQLIDCLRELMQVQESYLISVFQAIEDGYGTMDSFLEKEMGLCAEKREQLREMYLEG